MTFRSEYLTHNSDGSRTDDKRTSNEPTIFPVLGGWPKEYSAKRIQSQTDMNAFLTISSAARIDCSWNRLPCILLVSSVQIQRCPGLSNEKTYKVSSKRCPHKVCSLISPSSKILHLHSLFTHEISKLKHSALQLVYSEHGLEMSVEDIKELAKSSALSFVKHRSAHTISKAPYQVR